MSHPVERWQGHQVNSTRGFDRRSLNIFRTAQHRVLAEEAQALESAAVVRGAAYVGDELMGALDQLRRHEARAAAEDPLIADEYAAIRRAVLGAGLDELHRYGRRP